MIKKVALVVGLFLVVDRVMYYKLGQTAATQEKYVLSAPAKSLHKLAKQERKVRRRFALYARYFFDSKKSDTKTMVC